MTRNLIAYSKMRFKDLNLQLLDTGSFPG